MYTGTRGTITINSIVISTRSQSLKQKIKSPNKRLCVDKLEYVIRNTENWPTDQLPSYDRVISKIPKKSKEMKKIFFNLVQYFK